jgi:uncharacterized protein YjbJ (UPF0337 family)
MTRDQVEAKANESVVIAEEMAGKATGTEQMQADDRTQKSKTRLREALGRVNEKLRGVKKREEDR